MKRLLLAAVLACGSPQASSQTQEDSLKNSILKREKLDKGNDTLLEYNNFKKTILLSIKNKDFETLGNAYIGFAKWHEDHTVLDSSIFYLQKGIDIYKKQNMSKLLADTYLLLSTNYNGAGEYEKSSEVAYKALAIYEKT